MPEKAQKRTSRSLNSAKRKLKRRQDFLEQNEAVVERAEAMVVNNDESEYLKEYLSLYKKLKKLVRKANKKALTTGQSREYYALCTLMSQQREVIADLRTLTDLSGQVQMIIEQVMRPMTSEIGQAWLTGYYHMRKLLIETTKEKDTQFALKKLDDITKDLSLMLQQQYETNVTKLSDTMLGKKDIKQIKMHRKRVVQ